MPELLVRDAMTENIVIVAKDVLASEAAKIMTKRDADCIIVTENSKPKGIVTASDFLRRVVAQGKLASGLRVKDIMSQPVISIDSQEDLIKASKLISENGVKRLVITENERVVGIVTSLEIAALVPEIGVKEREEREIGPSMCEVCSGYFEVLSEVNGKYVCEECRDILD
ncbi:MAG: cyclic nucleotide-binding/CBS domain-containing protein [Candidatus Methanofastidiosia archaeon]